MKKSPHPSSSDLLPSMRGAARRSRSDSHTTTASAPTPMTTNLNKASVRELLQLPGVGPAIAQRIIEARPFTSLAQLQQIKGIGPKRYLALVSDCVVPISEKESLKTESRAPTTRSQRQPKKKAAPLVDLNRATLKELATLLGVGPALAQRIADARPFRRRDEVTAVRGIGLITYEKMRHQLLDFRGSSSSSSSSSDSDGERQSTTPPRNFQNKAYQSDDAPSAVIGNSPSSCTIGDIRATVLPGATAKVLIASWNIRNLSKKRDAVPLHRIVEILEEFDVIALQEVRDTIVLKRLKNLMPGWDYIASPLVGSEPVTAGQKRRTEHFAFFYRRRVVAPVGVGRFDIPEATSSSPKVYVVRPPFIATFQTLGSETPPILFTLVNIHVVCGDVDSRHQEIDELRRLASRLKPRTLCDQRNFILLGDFNLAPQEIGSIGDGDIQFEPLILSPLSTTVGGKLLDNLWVSTCGDWFDYAMESGVYRIDWAFYPQSRGLPRQYETNETRARAQMERRVCSSDLSDHCPVWLMLGDASK